MIDRMLAERGFALSGKAAQVEFPWLTKHKIERVFPFEFYDQSWLLNWAENVGCKLDFGTAKHPSSRKRTSYIALCKQGDSLNFSTLNLTDIWSNYHD
ncbi:MAG: hypothetical protein ABJX32_21170 [Tateyamaria sp.]|uniref:hypothetical protein n=1 Tax=Tateyamaria sp. TaxID=1929288 RepID=UPI00329B7101